MLNSGLTWDAATIAKYVAKPKEFVPRNKMAFVGLKKEEEIADVVVYIQATCCS